MKTVFLISVCIGAVALGRSLLLLWQQRDWRLGFLTVLLILMLMPKYAILLSQGGSTVFYGAIGLRLWY